MKEKLIYIFALVLAICQTSCVSEVNQDLDITSNKVSKGAELENIAKLLASIDFDNNEVKKIHDGVTTALNNGLHEVYFMKELMGEDCKVVKETDQTRVFVDFIKSQVENKSLSQALSYYREFENDEKLQIYWPFSENWDGKTKPVISYLPDDNSQDKNIGYYYEGGELKSVVVDREYAKTHPVWIVNESMMGYNNIPDFNNFREGDFLNIAPRKQNIEKEFQQMTRSYLDCELLLSGVRALRIPGNSFFCESHTYTFHFHLPDPNDRTSTTYQQVVLTLTQAQLISGEFIPTYIELYDLHLDSEYHRDFRLTITKYVEPKKLIVQVPMRVNESGQTVTVMSEMVEPEDAYLFYARTIDLQPFYDEPFDDFVFTCEELEWTMELAVFASI